MRILSLMTAALVAVSAINVPAFAMSPGECKALQQQIARSRSLARTGGIAETGAYRAAIQREEGLRSEMVRMGCNKRANANKPECQAIIAQVNEAKAARNAMLDEIRRAARVGAAIDEAELTARYEAECRNQAQRQRDPNVDAAIATGLIFGLGTMMTPSYRGPRRGH